MEFIKKVITKIKSGMLQEMYHETKWMYTYAWKYRYQILFYIVLGIFTIKMNLQSTSYMGALISSIGRRDMNMVVQNAIYIIALAVIIIIVNGVASIISARINIKVNNEIQAEVYDKILVTDWMSMQEFHSGDILNRLNSDVNTVASNVLGWLPNFVKYSLEFIWTLFVIVRIDSVMAVIALISAPVMVISSRILIKNMRYYNKEMRKVSSEVMSFNEESFQHLQSIKSFDLVEFFSEKFRAVQGSYKKVFLDYNKFSVYTSSFMSILGLITSYACLGWAVYHYLWVEDQLNILVELVRYSSGVTSSFKSLVGLIPSVISATTCAGRLMEFFDLPKEDKLDDDKVELIENNTKNMGLTIELEDAEFSYDDTKVVFKNANVKASPGEIIALVGPSGEGKTTMVRLLLGIIKAKSGKAIIKDINGLSCNISAATRRFFAYVPQGNTIFSGTIADNMRMVKPDATDDEIVEALKAACAYDFVDRLPDGINSKVGERGGGFSEGQAQRLSIARALLRKSPILLLDEATSALDVFTEREVLRNIMNMGYARTCIVTTHRPSVLTMCDRVYKIDNGKVCDIDQVEVSRLIKDF